MNLFSFVTTQFVPNVYLSTNKCYYFFIEDIDLFFIETLSHLSELECEILLALYPTSGLIPVKEINKANTDPFLILGSIGRLKFFGLASTVTTSFVINGSIDNAFNESVCLTDLGKSFIQFCLNDSL